MKNVRENLAYIVASPFVAIGVIGVIIYKVVSGEDDE